MPRRARACLIRHARYRIYPIHALSNLHMSGVSGHAASCYNSPCCTIWYGIDMLRAPSGARKVLVCTLGREQYVPSVTQRNGTVTVPLQAYSPITDTLVISTII